MQYLSALVSSECAFLFAVVAVALSFTMRGKADEFGPDVSARFLETGKSYKRPKPGQRAGKFQSAAKEASFLRQWVAANAGKSGKPGPALNYANTILMRYDVVFAFALGLFLLIVTVLTAGKIGFAPPWPWVLAIPAAAYIVSDLGEDIMLARFLRDRSSIFPDQVALVRKLTLLKLCSISIAMALAALGAAIAVGQMLANIR